jgi:hypothetical protein
LAQLNPLPHPGLLQAESPEPLDAAKTESNFSVLVDWHDGQVIVSELELTSSSNFFPQSLHAYSKIGISITPWRGT